MKNKLIVQPYAYFELDFDKANAACTTVCYGMVDHFADVSKMVTVGSGAKQQPSKQNSPSPSRREKGLGDEGWSTLLATQNPHPPTPSPFIKGEGEMRSFIEMGSRSINNTWIDFSFENQL